MAALPTGRFLLRDLRHFRTPITSSTVSRTGITIPTAILVRRWIPLASLPVDEEATGTSDTVNVGDDADVKGDVVLAISWELLVELFRVWTADVRSGEHPVKSRKDIRDTNAVDRWTSSTDPVWLTANPEDNCVGSPITELHAPFTETVEVTEYAMKSK